MNVAVALSVSEWNDSRAPTWGKIFDLLGLSFYPGLSVHPENKDKQREEQRQKRSSIKEQAQLARKLERILETDSIPGEANCEETSENLPR